MSPAVPGGGAALADVLLAAAQAAAAAGGEISPDPFPGQVFAGGRKFPGDLVPVTLKFLGHQLGEAREGALPHLGAGDADGARP